MPRMKKRKGPRMPKAVRFRIWDQDVAVPDYNIAETITDRQPDGWEVHAIMRCRKSEVDAVTIVWKKWSEIQQPSKGIIGA